MSDAELREFELAVQSSPGDTILRQRLEALRDRYDLEVTNFRERLAQLANLAQTRHPLEPLPLSIRACVRELVDRKGEDANHSGRIWTFYAGLPDQRPRVVVAGALWDAKTHGYAVRCDIAGNVPNEDLMLTIGVAARIARCATEHSTRSFQIAFNQANFITTGRQARPERVPGYLRWWAAKTKCKKVVRAPVPVVLRWLARSA